MGTFALQLAKHYDVEVTVVDTARGPDVTCVADERLSHRRDRPAFRVERPAHLRAHEPSVAYAFTFREANDPQGPLGVKT